jgi:hypothetical protein
MIAAFYPLTPFLIRTALYYSASLTACACAGRTSFFLFA